MLNTFFLDTGSLCHSIFYQNSTGVMNLKISHQLVQPSDTSRINYNAVNNSSSSEAVAISRAEA